MLGFVFEPANVALLFDPNRGGPGFRVFALADERAVAIGDLGRLLASLGVSQVEAQAPGRDQLLLPDGRIAALACAHAACPHPAWALVVHSGSQPMAVYLLANSRAVAELSAELAQNGHASRASLLEQVPSDAPDDAPTLRFGEMLRTSAHSVRLAELAIRSGAQGATHSFGVQLCPRCQDQALAANPDQDARDAQGRRICLACAYFARLAH